MCLISIAEHRQLKWIKQVVASSCCRIWSTHFAMYTGMWQIAVLAGKYQQLNWIEFISIHVVTSCNNGLRGTCYPHVPEETLVCVCYWHGITLVCACYCDGITLVCLLLWRHHIGMCLLLWWHHIGMCLLLTQHHTSHNRTFWLQFCRYFKIFMLKNSIQYSLDIHNWLGSLKSSQTFK